jgi:hypothetical protein
MADQAPPQFAEGYREKMMRKIKTEPYVPIGALSCHLVLVSRAPGAR